MKNQMPPGLIANLQGVLLGRKEAAGENGDGEEKDRVSNAETNADSDQSLSVSKPVVIVTNSDGIESPGIVLLVEALVRDEHYDVYVCAPESDQFSSGHSVTFPETIAASSAEIEGATAFAISGTPADCVSLALSGALFSWSRPVLVISGINKGTSCGHNIFYSGSIAGAREASMSGIPSLSISLNWRKDESQESNFKEAVDVCLPFIRAAIRDADKEPFLKGSLMSIEIPAFPSTSKGFKLTRQSLQRPVLSWQAVSSSRHLHSAQYMPLAQLSRDASAAGKARLANTHKKNEEVESVAGARKPEQRESVKKFFRLEFLQKEQEDVDEELDFRAVENGYIAITPVNLTAHNDPEIQTSTSDWLASALQGCKEASSG